MTDWEGREKGSVSQSQPVLASNGQPEAEPSALADLLARVEAATGPDREIDFWLTVLCWDPDPNDDLDALRADIALVSIEEMFVQAPFSASLDAALALVERVLPGWCRMVDENIAFSGRLWTGYLFTPPDVRPAQFEGHSKRPAPALIAAMLRALIATARERERHSSPRQVERADSRDTKKSIPKSAGKESAP